MPATAEPPVAPPADTGVAQGAPATGAKPSSFRPPNPAFDRVVAKVQSRARPAPTQASPEPEKPAEPKPKPEAPKDAKPDDSPPPTPELDDTSVLPEEGKQSGEPTETKEGEAAAEPKKEKKVSPWRLVDEWKKTASDWKTKAETASQELERIKAGKPAELPKEVTERITQAEAKIKEYEDHIKFLDYQRHPEFQDKYQKPYESAWKLATSELAEVTVTDPATGTTRNATPEDMLALINLPLGKAREYANQMFGDFADDAMAHRKTIKGLFDAQQSALKEARENGAKRLNEMQEQQKAQQEQVSKLISETWSEANRAAVTDEKYGKFFAPVEGDQQGNAALAKGFEFADKAMSANAWNPELTPEQRKEVLRMQAAWRNRAAAFGRMRQWIDQRDTRIAALEKELADYKKSEPASTGTTKPSSVKDAGDPWSRIEQGIRKRASR